MKPNLTFFGSVVTFALVAISSRSLPAQMLYAADYANSTIEEYSLSGGNSSAKTFATTGLYAPMALVTYGGDLYVGNHGDDTIEEYSLAGGNASAKRFATGISSPQALAAAGGNLFVALANNTIEEYSLTTGMGKVFATTGLNLPHALAVAGGNLYVANEGNNTIEEYSLSVGNASATTFASAGLSGPVSLAISGGNLYAGNIFSDTIEKFSLAGGNASASQFSTTLEFNALAASGGYLYAASTNYNTIVKDSLTGGASSIFATTGLNAPFGIAISPEPSTWVMMVGGLGMLLLFRRFRTAR